MLYDLIITTHLVMIGQDTLSLTLSLTRSRARAHAHSAGDRYNTIYTRQSYLIFENPEAIQVLAPYIW